MFHVDWPSKRSTIVCFAGFIVFLTCILHNSVSRGQGIGKVAVWELGPTRVGVRGSVIREFSGRQSVKSSFSCESFCSALQEMLEYTRMDP